MINNRPPMDATGGAASRKPDQTADFDGRGGDHTAEGGGGRPAPEPQGAPRGVRAVRKPFRDDYGMVVWVVNRILDRRLIC